MSAVEQARAELMRRVTVWTEVRSESGWPLLRKEDAIDALIAAVRAERDAAWREGVETETRKVRPVTCRECKPGEACADALREAEESAANRALAALAARMEAK